jgi:hypothetical protein
MSTITTILLAIIGSSAISGSLGAWLGSVLTRDKYKAEIDALRADVASKLSAVENSELDNVRKANQMLVETVVEPLQKEITSLRRNVDKFRKAIEKIPGCPHANECPVSRQLWSDEDIDNQPKDAQ